MSEKEIEPTDVVPADLARELYEAIEFYFERARLGHNDGTRRIDAALTRYRKEVGE